MNLFYKIHLQALNVISTVPYHSGQTFGQVLYCCQDAFVVDASVYWGHLIRHLLSASESLPTEWFLRFGKQVKGWWAHVRTVRRMGKHLPSILFKNFRYCTWGMRPRVNVWSLFTARDLTPVSSFFHFAAPFGRTGTTWHANTHTAFFTEVSGSQLSRKSERLHHPTGRASAVCRSFEMTYVYCTSVRTHKTKLYKTHGICIKYFTGLV